MVGELNSTVRPQDRTDVARYFAVAVPAQLWNQAARQVSEVQGKSLSENAHAFALLNMAISDGLVSVMETKYHYVFWRPITDSSRRHRRQPRDRARSDLGTPHHHAVFPELSVGPRGCELRSAHRSREHLWQGRP